MDNICKFHKFGYCKLQDECEKQPVKEEYVEGYNCKVIKKNMFKKASKNVQKNYD